MSKRGWGRRNRWWPPFILALGTLGGALGFLVMATMDSSGTDSTPAQGGAPSASPSAASRSGLTYEGALPAALADTPSLKAGEPGKAADLRFEAVESGGVVARYFVPVASWSSALDAVTSAELLALMYEGPVTTVAGLGVMASWAAVEQDLATVSRFGPAPGGTVATYDDLRAGMNRPGVYHFAFVPLAELRPGMVALAIDGVDLVRGVGDPMAWRFAERVAVTGLTDRGRAAVPALEVQLAAPLPVVTRIAATGDILMSRCTLAKIRATGDWSAPFRGPVGAYLAAADIALGSLDGSIQDIGEPYGCIATTNLTSPAETIAALTTAGFDGMTVATNHAFDCGDGACGSRALLRSMELLRGAGIKTTGGGANLAEALAPAIFEVNGVRIGVLGFDDIAAEDIGADKTSPGTAPLDDTYADDQADLPREPAFYKPAALLGLERFSAAIRKLKAEVDVVIVQVQSGTEDTHDPSVRSIKALRAAVDAGADLVVGNQAHWVQAVELRNGVFVAYALGNFVFDQLHTPEHSQGYILEATLHGKRVIQVRMLPYQIVEQHRPEFVTGELRAKIIRDVVEAAEALGSR